MSADSFHHQVEQNNRNKRKSYDFNNYQHNCVEGSGTAVQMKPEDFKDLKIRKVVEKEYITLMLRT